jgi:hypothetical protein
MRLLLILLFTVGAAQAAYAQSTALPEVLLVVDTSQSMQFRVGDNNLPRCESTDPANPDEMSRWNIVRSVIGGSFDGYTCKYEALPPVPEAVNPPAQTVGTPACIAGLGMTLSSPYDTKPTLSGGMASRTFPSGNLGPDDPGASYQSIWSAGTYTLRTMWLEFDLTDIPQMSDWAGAIVTIPGHTLNLDPQPTQVQLVLSPSNPPQIGVDLCSVAQAGQIVLSAPVTLPLTTGAGSDVPLVLGLTDQGSKALEAMRKAGSTSATVALVPVGLTFDNLCLGVSGGPKTNVQFVPSTTSPLSTFSPVMQVSTGVQCPAEGPTKHAVALALQSDGSSASVPTGQDGLIDVFGPMAKFSLLAGDNIMNKGTTAIAGFSFADDLSSIWGNINMGLMDPYLSGTLSVPIPGPDDLASRAAAYAAIQNALTLMRPNGPTPTGAALTDVQAYLGPSSFMDPHFRTQASDPINGDPYLACRKKMVVVLSDGGGNLYNGTTDGRAAAIQVAATLFATNIPVYVFAVGFPVDSTPTGPEWQFLNDLAAAGGTQAAHIINTPQEAVATLAPAIDAAAINGLVLTRPVYTNATGTVNDVQHSFQTISIFDLSQPLRTRGVIEQRIFKCDAACKSDTVPNTAQVCGIINYAERLRLRTIPRRLYTHTLGLRLPLDNTHVSPFDLGLATVGTFPRLQLQPDTSCGTAGTLDLSIPTQRNTARDEILATLRGDTGTCRQNHPLGAASRAQPALLEPAARLPIRDPSFRTYVSTPVPPTGALSANNPPGSANRPTMLFAATHDGLLHAFRTDEDPSIATKDLATAGDEMWSFLPRFNLSRIAQMKLVTSPDASFLNAPITAQHVLLQRDVSAGATSISTALNWRAVVIIGAGEGGSGYTALDVTSPEDPQVMWEITPDRHCFGAVSVGAQTGPTCLFTGKFGDMGRSTARPVIANLFYTNDGGVSAERAVVILPFGKDPSLDTSIVNNGVEGSSASDHRGVYVLDLSNGEILRTFTTDEFLLTGAPLTISDTTLLGRFWTEPSCFNNAAGQIATRCILGDSKGMVWRLDLAAPSPLDWRMRFFFDLYSGPSLPTALQFDLNSVNRMPITSQPSLSTTQGGDLTVVIGSGNADLDTGTTARDVVVSLKEAISVAADGTSSPPLGTLNWVKILDSGERFVGPPLVFAFYAYWATFVVSKNGLCDIGAARLWGVRYERSQSPTDLTNTIGAFPNPQALTSVNSNLDFLDVGSYRPSPVDLQPEPSCISGCPPNNPQCVLSKGAALGGVPPKYQLGVAVAGNVQSAYQTPKSGSNGSASVGTIAVTPPQPRTAAIITGWDLLLD